MAIYRYRVFHTGVAGSPYLSTHYGDVAAGSPQAFATLVGGFWTAGASQRVSTLISVGDTVVDELSEVTGDLMGSIGVSDFSSTGSAAAAMAPPAVQGLLRLQTGVIVGGRRLEGKIYLPGVPAAAITGIGGVAATYRQSWENAAAAYLGASGSAPVVWSRKNGEARPVDSAQVWANWAVLRSRRD